MAAGLAKIGLSPGLLTEQAIESHHTFTNLLRRQFRQTTDEEVKISKMFREVHARGAASSTAFDPKARVHKGCGLPIAKTGNECFCTCKAGENGKRKR